MKIVVMGAGGVGGYFGGRLAQAGNEVSFVARGKHLEALKAGGLRLKTPEGEALIKVKAAENPAELGPAEVILFAVKLWDTESAAERLRPLTDKGAVVIPFQNGVESIERIAKVLGAERVMGGAAYIAARISEPGVITQAGIPPRLRFGAVLPGQKKVAEAFHAACKQAGIDVELSDDVVKVLWEKFVALVGLSSATTVTRQPIGVVRADPDMRWLLESCMRETWTLGRKKGIALSDEVIPQTLKFMEGMAPGVKASMAADLEAGSKLEAPWLAGAVARMSREVGLDAPVNRAVYAALTPYVNGDSPHLKA
ncbi:MAG TPA: 2-dehydropantoate 2-reductase [Burkholderiales bacterium]|nr:2-dehydropantoate 2-reductase [Burkholderiales bacterium]